MGKATRVFCWVILLALAACAGRKPDAPLPGSGRDVYHRVVAGDTLYAIGRYYGVSYTEIARANQLKDPAKIRVGQRLLIPGAGTTARLPSGVNSKKSALPRNKQEQRDPAAPSFQWPVPGGKVVSGFGKREGNFHDGVDLAAPLGTPVQAAADGTVAYCGQLPGYGNVVILRHSSGYATVYAHNDRNLAKEGEAVRRGQRIATVGRTGRTSGPNLHFEIRKNNAAQDPLRFLSRSAQK